ncbi:MAG: hypothetical protein H7Z41_09835, partial [Cytophagales bacterium]|nr:hypothetical protein [Armatimonadota bacterium]
VYRPASEPMSLRPIGGGEIQPSGAPPGSATPTAPTSAVAPAAPLAPPTLGAMAPLAAPGGAVGAAAGTASAAGAASAASAPSAPPTLAGLSPSAPPLGGPASGNAAPIPDVLAALNTPPDATNPYLNSGRPEIENRPTSYGDEGNGFDSRKALMIGAGALVALLLFFVAKAVLPSKIAVPTAFTTHTSTTNAFALEVPTDWSRSAMDTKREDSMTGQQYESDVDGVMVRQGKAVIDVSTDDGADVKQNQLLSGGGPNFGALLDDKHKQHLAIMKKRVSGFTETEASGFSLAPFGAKMIEYTGTSGFLGISGKVHGYAATVQGPNHFMQIFLQCPENNWDDLKPVYQRILKSVTLDGVNAQTLQDSLGGGAGGLQVPGGDAAALPFP